MLRLEHISKIYPTGEVLKDVNWLFVRQVAVVKGLAHHLMHQ